MVAHKETKSRSSQRIRKKVKLQPRDKHVVWFAGVHGIVTMLHIKRFAFEGFTDDGFWESVSDQAVYRRLKKLCDAGLLVHKRTWYGDHGIYRATRSGLAMADLDLDPVRLEKRDYEHDLQVVDLALELTDYTCEGWIPERLIRSHIKPGMSIGRVSDGLMFGPGGERWAIELEVSGKESQRYHEACDKYVERHRARIPEGSGSWELEDYLDDYFDSKGEIDGVVWYFFSDKKRRRALAAAERVLRECNEVYYRTDHLHFRFQDANYPEPPPFDKWEAQIEGDRLRKEQHERERREEAERREEQRRHAEAVTTAESYLTPKEQERSIEDARTRKSETGKGWQLTGREREQALIDAMHDKHEREQERERRRRQTRDSISRFFGRA